jgi:long-chain acyl-CoA synthetase
VQTTFPRLMLEHARQRPTAPALREKVFGIWQTLTWGDLAQLVRELAGGLAVAGLKRGDHIVVVGDNRPRLYASMLAAQALGAVPVPLYQDAPRPSSSSRSSTPRSASPSSRTRSRSTSCSRSATSARCARASGTTIRAACATTSEPGLAALDALIAGRSHAQAIRASSTPRSPRAAPRTWRRCSSPPAPPATQGRGAHALHAARPRRKAGAASTS